MDLYVDYENRLKQAGKSGGVTVTYAYDALGRRVQRTSSTGGTTKFVFDGADVVRDLDGGGATTADYLNGPGIDNKLRQTSGGTSAYLLDDHLGTTRALADASGNIAASLNYDSYGNVISGSALTRYTYTGREIDSDTGLMYYRARWYDPQQGRFISEDPISIEGGPNLYSYVRENPVSFSDPLGLQPRKIPRVRNATPAQQNRFDAAYLDVLRRLKGCECAKLFGGYKKALRALEQTFFSFKPLGDPLDMSVLAGDAVTNGRRVIINSQATFMATNGTLQGHPRLNLGADITTKLVTIPGSQDLRPVVLGEVENAAFILLHELGHRRKSYGKDDNDGEDPRAGWRNNTKIWEACFK